MGKKLTSEQREALRTDGKTAAKIGKRAETPYTPNPKAKPIDPKTQLPSNNSY